jgi:hypothetical protein
MEIRKHLIGFRVEWIGGLPMAVDSCDGPALGGGLSVDFDTFDYSDNGLRSLLGNWGYPHRSRLEHAGYWSGICHYSGAKWVCRIARERKTLVLYRKRACTKVSHLRRGSGALSIKPFERSRGPCAMGFE